MMNSTIGGTPKTLDTLDTKKWIEREKLRLVFANLPVALTLSFAAGCFLAFILRNVQPASSLAIWLLGSAAIGLYRYSLTRRFKAQHEDQIDIRHWRQNVDIGTTLSGAWWGAVAVFLFPTALPQQVFVAYILAGVSAAAMTSYAAQRRTYLLFMMPSVVPLIARLALEGSEVHLSMAALASMFLVVVVKSTINTENMIHTVLVLRAENLELTHALHHDATHDALVDLVNYREFNSRLQGTATRSAQEHQPYALLFIDLDNFKSINDSAGHAAGDEALRRIGLLLKSHLRANDTAARMGGDEFAVLLPGCPRDRAEMIANHILVAMRDMELLWEGQKLELRASIGVAYTNAGEYDTGALLRAADSACYVAKRSGRNQVIVHHAEPSHETSGRFHLQQSH